MAFLDRRSFAQIENGDPAGDDARLLEGVARVDGQLLDTNGVGGDGLARRKRLARDDHRIGCPGFRPRRRRGGGRGRDARRRLSAENPSVAAQGNGDQYQDGCDDFREVDHGRWGWAVKQVIDTTGQSTCTGEPGQLCRPQRTIHKAEAMARYAA